MANKIAEYGYMPDSDFNDAVSRISTILKELPDGKDALDKVQLLLGELLYTQETIERDLAARKASEPVPEGKQELVN